ncbi:glycosyltransferase family 2 protein [Roseitranquillus sediminis]|uniref:glycosyltransferase family 2 protein n=1 Tax=Roseitranquillus sediminis TaxID=2809051 RepID=UPI001D0C7BE7|nr:glycosyltransferase family 2 protein [Roseitranquillus sediminis]MBM9593292.1 glycosyltransferase family 2 protein [Roseitranquillus sediminis]
MSAVGDLPFREVFDMDAPPPAPRLDDGPVAISVSHNEMLRLPDFLRHHRQIGIRHFYIVDHASTDGSGDYLDAQPDVTRLYSRKPFQQFKPIFRAWPCDHYAVGRWILNPDIDEHLVYPGWPEVPLPRLLSHWDATGSEAVFAPMVDMYADRPLAEVHHDSDVRLRNVYPLFDGEGYWIAPPKPRTRRDAPTPPYLLYGGARSRYGKASYGMRERVAKGLMRRLMDYRDPTHPRPGAWFVQRYLLIRGSRPFGIKSKLGLIKWRRGMTFPGSSHRIRARLKLAPDWAALLHFRLMIDYAAREEMWRHRKDRGPEATAHTANVVERAFEWEGSRRLESWRDLLDAGLLRMSDDLATSIGLRSC